MRNSPLVERFRQAGGTLSDYCGGLTRTDGGEGTNFFPHWPESQVLLYDSSWRAALAVTGPDARKWLNGMVTANLRDLVPGAVAPSFQLDPKGHILATLDVACLAAESFLLLSDEAQRAGLLDRLRRFVFISKLTIEDRSEAWGACTLRGPAWGAAWRRAELPALAIVAGQCAPVPLPEAPEASGAGLAIVSAPGNVPQVELWAPASALPGLWERLSAVATPAGTEVYERDRILSRVPRFGTDLGPGELPQETGQADRLDFTKGCYIGQEIVERIRARGAVHRHWTGFAFPAAVAPGTPVQVEGREVGQVTSVAARGAGWFGLGYIRDPFQGRATPVQAGAVAGLVEA